MNDDKRLTRIEAKIDHQAEDLADINVTLAGQHTSLAEHIKRTNALQTIVESLNRKVTLAEGALKLLGGAAILAEIARIFMK